MKRVLLMSYSLDLGGSERQLTEVAKALDRRRFEVHVGCQVAKGIRAEELRAAGVSLADFPMSSYFSLRALAAAAELSRYIRRNRIDLVHAFDVPMDVFALPVARLHRRTTVLGSQRAHRSLTTGPRLFVLRAMDRAVDGIVVNCEYMRRHLIDEEHTPLEKIHLCYNGIDTNLFAPGEGAQQERPLTVGSVCALRAEKNLSLLLRAFVETRETSPDVRMTITGDGPMRAELETLAGDLNLGDCFQLLPGTRDVPGRLREIDVFVLPSRTEALSNSLMEAMSCGCAAIASRVGGNPELIGANERGLLFEPDSVESLVAALQTLIHDATLRRKLGRHAREWIAENLSIGASVKRMEEIYWSFLGEQGNK